jgi:hypothetical protein
MNAVGDTMPNSFTKRTMYGTAQAMTTSREGETASLDLNLENVVFHLKNRNITMINKEMELHLPKFN